MEGATERQVHLLDYWQVLVKRRWVVYSAVLLVTGMVALGTFLTRPMYTATAQLQIEKFSPNVLPWQDPMTNYSDWRDDFYETQSRLIQSRSVASSVVSKLNLAKHPYFELPRDESGPSPEQAEILLADMVRGGVEVELIRNSRLANVSFTSPEPELSAAVANALADAYMEFNARNAYNTSERATESMTRQIESLRGDIADKERRVQQYAREQEIIPLDERSNVTTQKLNDLNSAFTKAQTVRIEKEARYAALKETPPEAIQELMINDLLQTLSAKHAELEREHAQMASRFKPDWPAMTRVKTELENTRKRLEAERTDLHQRMLGSAREAYLAALKEEQSLGQALEQQKSEAQEAGLRAIEYNSLKIEVDNSRKTLEALMKRQTETDASAGMMDNPISNVRIVDSAVIPEHPSSPRRRLNILLALVAGLGLGIALAFFFDYMDDSVNGAEDLTRAAGLACLGLIPVHAQQGRRLRVVRSRAQTAEESRPEIDLATLLDARSQVSEAFRELRTALMVSSPGRPPRTLLVTSSQPREGKTSTALNLAITLSQLSRRVLLVDADLRKPRLHRALSLSNGSGLSSCLSGAAELASLVMPAGPPGVWLLPSGPIPPNPAELLDSAEFAALVDRLTSDGLYDHVIFDSPPLLSVADASIMAARMDAVILVVQAGATPRDSVARAAEKLRVVKAKLTGALLNKLDQSAHGGYYRSYYSYYGEPSPEGPAEASPPPADEAPPPPADEASRKRAGLLGKARR